MLNAIQEIFEQYAEGGHVTFNYNTRIYLGKI